MELLKITILFVSLACPTFGKFIKPQRLSTSERFEDTFETAETLQDGPFSDTEERANDYLSRFLAVPAADSRYRNMCKTKSTRTKSYDFFGEPDKEFHPATFSEKYCASESDGEPKRCGSVNYCVTQTLRMEFYERPEGSTGIWRKKTRAKPIRVGCSCMARH